MCIRDRANPLFASKIVGMKTLIGAFLNIFYFSIGSGLLAILALVIMTIATKEN